MKLVPNTEDWIQRIKATPSQALRDLYAMNRKEFVFWAIKHFGASQEEAKDAFQESLIGLYENVAKGKFEDSGVSMKSYLFQIGKHKLIDGLRKNESTTYLSDFQTIKGKEATEFQMEEQNEENIDKLKRALQQLPSDCRDLLELYYFKNFDMDSIAKELQLKNANSAKSKKLDCMKRLIKIMNEMTHLFIL